MSRLFIAYCHTPQKLLNQRESGTDFGDYRKQVLQEIRAVAKGLLAKGIQAQAGFLNGPAVDTLVGEAVKLPIDLILLGFDELSDSDLGSLAEAIALATNRPVIAFGRKARAAHLSPPSFTKILAAAGLHDGSNPSVQYAARLAKRIGATHVDVVHVVDTPNDFSRPHGSMDLQYSCESLAGAMHRHGVPAEGQLVYGEPVAAITSHAHATQPSLIVCGVSSRKQETRKNVPQLLVQEAACPVMIVPFTQTDLQHLDEAKHHHGVV